MVSERAKKDLEFEVQSLQPEKVVQTIKDSACALIRQAIPEIKLQELNLLISNAYESKDRAFKKGMLAPVFVHDWYRYGYLFMNEMDTRPAQPWVILHTLLNSPIKDILVALHGPSFYFILINTTFRRQPVKNPREQVPFHQDSFFMDGAEGIINCWLPLRPCGIDAASLELVTVPQRKLVPVNPKDQHTDGYFEHSNISLMWKGKPFTLEIYGPLSSI